MDAATIADVIEVAAVISLSFEAFLFLLLDLLAFDREEDEEEDKEIVCCCSC